MVKISEIYVVDIGASGGIHPRWEKSPQPVKAVLFEPDPREYDKLKGSVDENCIVLNTALSDSPGEINFYLYKFQQASSVYLPDLALLERYHPNMSLYEIVKTIKVTADTIDNQLDKVNLTNIDFIKLDVQGHELPILQGGINTLKNVIGVEVEVEFLPVYQNQPVFSDVDCFLTNMGFELFDIKRTFLNRCDAKIYGNRKGQLVWGDALYFRSPKRILSIPTITAEKIRQAISIYLVYGYADMARIMYRLAKEKAFLPERFGNEIEILLAKYEVEKMDILPKFRGKNKLHRLFRKLTEIFSTSRRTDRSGKYSQQVDKHLGNILH